MTWLNELAKEVEGVVEGQDNVTPAAQLPISPLNSGLVKLEWAAERARKVERIKKLIAEGRYAIDSRDVAAAMLNLDK